MSIPFADFLPSKSEEVKVLDVLKHLASHAMWSHFRSLPCIREDQNFRFLCIELQLPLLRPGRQLFPESLLDLLFAVQVILCWANAKVISEQRQVDLRAGLDDVVDEHDEQKWRDHGSLMDSGV